MAGFIMSVADQDTFNRISEIVLAQVMEREGIAAAEKAASSHQELAHAGTRIMGALFDDVNTAIRQATDGFEVMRYELVEMLCAKADARLRVLRELYGLISPGTVADMGRDFDNFQNEIEGIRTRNGMRNGPLTACASQRS